MGFAGHRFTAADPVFEIRRVDGNDLAAEAGAGEFRRPRSTVDARAGWIVLELGERALRTVVDAPVGNGHVDRDVVRREWLVRSPDHDAFCKFYRARDPRSGFVTNDGADVLRSLGLRQLTRASSFGPKRDNAIGGYGRSRHLEKRISV